MNDQSRLIDLSSNETITRDAKINPRLQRSQF